MIDEKTEDLLQRAIEERSDESLRRLARHLQRGGYCSCGYPTSFQEVCQYIEAADDWMYTQTQGLAERIKGILGPLQHSVKISLSTRVVQRSPHVSIRLRRTLDTRNFYEIDLPDTDPTAVPDSLLFKEVSTLSKRFGFISLWEQLQKKLETSHDR